jgi:bifunctional enzyme CysN/CysC
MNPDVHPQHVDVDRAARAAAKRQKPCVLWFTGLSGAGKSTVSNLVDRQLHAMGYHTYLLDGDNVRLGLNRDLGFAPSDRSENIRRVAEVARLMFDAGLIVSTAFISPFRAERSMARALFAAGDFVEVYIDTPLDVAERRDPKGLYQKARRGELKHFTGIDSPYEAPTQPEIRVDGVAETAAVAARRVIDWLDAHGVLLR